jgi:hypothetical protein
MKNVIIGVIVVALLAAIYLFGFKGKSTETTTDIETKVQEGEFKVHVTATGELQAKRSEKIRGPKGMQAARIYNTTIADIVPEGTLVEAGDYVARLDRSELDGKIKDISGEIEKKEAQLTQAKIDTAITLRGVRDQLVNLQFSMKEKDLEVEQSKYEPPAVIRRVELDLERIKRDFVQQQTNYKLKQQQAVAKVQEILSSLEQTQRRLAQMVELSQQFSISAPKPGMVIYERSWQGKKGPGSRISPWDPIVAQLPDLSSMISKTYVNEVDINKISTEQDVILQVDAFPDKYFKGKVIDVANIGEQMRKFDAKVFEVIIELTETDTVLRPAMTTSNKIVTKVYDKALFLPLEAIQNDSLTYVFKKNENGELVKQVVITGDFNDDQIIIRYGLQKGENVSLSVPDNKDDLEIVQLPEADKTAYQKEKDDLEQRIKEQAVKAAELKAKREKEGAGYSKPTNGGGGDFIIIN